MKRITVWEAKSSGEWNYNHFEDGWSTRDMPRAINDAQRKAWSNREWRRSHCWLDDTHTIVKEHTHD